MNACTIIARNYLAQARVLAHSFLEHHPSGEFTVLVIDGEQPFPREPGDEFTVLIPTEVGLDERELHRMAIIYDVMELATAVKPWLLKTLLAQGATDVTYLDPDIEIFRPLDDIAELAREHSIVLTPHTLKPLPHDRRQPGETTLLLAGMFNLGFIAVSRRAGDFLDWWEERVARAGRVDPHQGEFVDQRWVDFVPSLFEHTVLRDPACNVAHWNLETRRFELVHGEYRVDGKPLRFFHFSGFDPEKPYLLSKFLGPEPRILLSKHDALAKICSAYADKLLAAGYREAKKQTYGFGTLPNDLPVDDRMRRLYRRELEEVERRGGDEPPDPFDAEGAQRFVEWLNEPAHRAAPLLTRYLSELHADRADLRQQFPDPRWAEAEQFFDWVWSTGRSEGIPLELVPDLEPPPRPESPVSGGVNVAGYFRAEAGVGQAARHLLVGLRRYEIPFTTVAYDKTPARQSHMFEETGEATYDTNIVCVNADELPRFTYDIGPEFFRNRYSVGLWWWEVSRFPRRFHDAFDVIDEIWVGSDFVRDAIAAETEKPVFTFPLAIELPDGVPETDRERLRLPQGFIFLFSFDFDGRFERKNPLGLVEAFTQAFEHGEGPTLVLKSLNGDRWLTKLEQLRSATAGRHDIVLMDGYLSAADTESLTASCDCYVSLHRSEGFGLTMAEAMAHGKPVIATRYSGNLEYMTPETSLLVPYRLTPIPTGIEPYPAGTEWAEPDVTVAAQLMRRVYESPDEAARIGGRAKEHVAERLSPDRTGEFIKARLAEIRELPSVGGRTPDLQTRPSGVTHASRYLSDGPSNPIRGPSRFGFLGRLARRGVYRILRPYTTRHAEFETAVVDALQELDDRLQGLDTRVSDARKRSFAERARLERHARDLSQHMSHLERHARDLSQHLNRIDRESAALGGQLYATPFMTDPQYFRTTSPDGEEALGYSGQGDHPTEGASYRDFEDLFRGPEKLILERQRAFVDVVARHEPVLDVGCGRGEFLDLLRDAGIDGRGVDVNEDMVEHCRAKGHRVELAEATEYLAGQADETFGAIFSAQVIEHLPYERLLRFFELVRAKLAPGGILVAETVNPHSLSALKTFWVDLTHEKPIFPEVALALCRLHGFESAQVFFPNGSGELERDRREQGEYAVIATVALVQQGDAEAISTGEGSATSPRLGRS